MRCITLMTGHLLILTNPAQAARNRHTHLSSMSQHLPTLLILHIYLDPQESQTTFLKKHHADRQAGLDQPRATDSRGVRGTHIIH